jgi:hypothetical protein
MLQSRMRACRFVFTADDEETKFKKATALALQNRTRQETKKVAAADVDYLLGAYEEPAEHKEAPAEHKAFRVAAPLVPRTPNAFAHAAVGDFSSDDEDESQSDASPARTPNPQPRPPTGVAVRSGGQPASARAIRSGGAPRSGLQTRGQNTGLEIGSACSRTFVFRESLEDGEGTKIGVFDAGDDDVRLVAEMKQLSFGNKAVNATIAQLHQSDNKLLLLDSSRSESSIFCLDIERGEIVEEWKPTIRTNASDRGEARKVRNVAPVSKFAQKTHEQTLLASNNAHIFQLDPRQQVTGRAACRSARVRPTGAPETSAVGLSGRMGRSWQGVRAWRCGVRTS